MIPELIKKCSAKHERHYSAFYYMHAFKRIYLINEVQCILRIYSLNYATLQLMSNILSFIGNIVAQSSMPKNVTEFKRIFSHFWDNNCDNTTGHTGETE